MFGHSKPEVLVVGAGPVGLYTALALNHQGIRVHVVDEEPRTSAHSYALALHAESLRLLEELDALTDVLSSAQRIRRIGLFDRAGRKAEMRISELAKDHSFLAVLPQNAFEKHLIGTLARRGVKVEWNQRVGQLAVQLDHVDVRIDSMELDTMGYAVQHSDRIVAKSKQHQFPFVVGADGRSSVVRQCLGIEFPAVAESCNFAVFEFQTDADLGDEMRVVLDDTTDVCWPLSGGFCRWSFELRDQRENRDERRKDHDLIQSGESRDSSLDEARLKGLLVERAPWFRGSIGDIRWRKAVRFEHRLAESFGRDRVWLAGDAGHLTGPVGIQSMNVGFREGKQLASAFAHLLHGTAPAAEIAQYDSTRRAEWTDLLGIKPVLRAGPSTDPWLAARKERLPACIPAAGADFTHLVEQLGFEIIQN